MFMMSIIIGGEVWLERGFRYDEMNLMVSSRRTDSSSSKANTPASVSGRNLSPKSERHEL